MINNEELMNINLLCFMNTLLQKRRCGVVCMFKFRRPVAIHIVDIEQTEVEIGQDNHICLL